jgi:exopolysaccharide production protein ExoZ
MSIKTPPSKIYFEPLQGLRAFAAMIVMIGHIKHEILMVSAKLGQDAPSWTALKLPYNAGVDIFFVLSGFLMVYTSQNLYGQKWAWFTFLKKRFQRIVPLYWFYTTLMIIVMLLLPHAFDTAQASINHFVQSYLFIPHERPAGGIKPVLSLGWTLNYEMFFYIVFAGLLFLSRHSLTAIMAVMFIGFSVVHYLLPETMSVPYFWTRPIILEFVMGMIIANMYLSNLRFSSVMVLPLIAMAVFAFFLMPYSMTVMDLNVYRLPNMTMAILLIGGLTLCKGVDQWRIPQWLKALGDSSYTLYLAHPFGIGAVALLAIQFNLGQGTHFILSLATCAFGSYIAYYLIEKNIIGYFKGKHCSKL